MRSPQVPIVFQEPARMQSADELHVEAVPPRNRRRTIFVLAAAFLVLLGASAAEYWYSATQSSRAAAPLVREATVQVAAEQIRLGLATDAVLRNEHIFVAASGHAIELHGTCSSLAARALINRYAAKVIDNRFVLVDNTTIASTKTSGSASHRLPRR